MVKGGFTIIGLATVLAVAFFQLNPMGYLSRIDSPASATDNIVYVSSPVVQEVPPSPTPPPPAATATRVGGATLPPAVAQVLKSGVLIVISKPSQQMYVFQDGELWDSSPVSTGKRGKETPAGLFPILQKRVHHRSNIYSNAPMPHMQRLTWGGIAIHAGRLPGYPASHGCIRLPKDVARALFSLTRPQTTAVVVTDLPVGSVSQAQRVALNMPAPLPGERGHLVQRREPPLPQLAGQDMPELAAVTPELFGEDELVTGAVADATIKRPVDLLEQARPRVSGPTIQLAAKGSPGEAEAYWSRIKTRYPELDRYQKVIIPAVVNSRQYYRLRVTGPGARATCVSIKRSGGDCFPVS
ncbi:L,D-transpeptidase family protein [Alteriqipengyuania sp. 357]